MAKRLFKWEINGQLRKLTMGDTWLATMYLQSGGAVEVTMNPAFFGKKGATRKSLHLAEDYVTNNASLLFREVLSEKFFEFVLLHNETTRR